MTVYFTSDTHFGHANIIQYTNRPWPNVPAMNEGLIANWNSVVKPEDTIYHLGDFAMGPKTEHKGFLDRLQGRKILIRGNHDQKPAKMLDMGFNEVHTNLLLRLGPEGTVVPEGGKLVYLSHIPIWNDPYAEKGRTYHPDYTAEPPQHDIWLCGHVHAAWKRKGSTINAGVDVWGYKPVTFQELLAAFDEAL